MAKLSSFENEAALELMANIIDPVSDIMTDKEFKEAVLTEGKKTKAVQIALRNHKESIIDIMAALEETPRDEYKANIIQITKSLLEFLNDKELVGLFQLQGQTEDENASGPASENTEGRSK